jgi:hypothetical protein
MTSHVLTTSSSPWEGLLPKLADHQYPEHGHILGRLTLLESILQSIGPDRLPILTCVPTRSCSVFKILLGLQIASLRTNRGDGLRRRLQSSELLGMQACCENTAIMQTGTMHRMVWSWSRRRVLQSQRLEMVVTVSTITIRSTIRVRLCIARGVLESSIRASSNTL